MFPRKIKDEYHLCFQNLQRLPLSLRDSANSTNSENTPNINPSFYDETLDYLYKYQEFLDRSENSKFLLFFPKSTLVNFSVLKKFQRVQFL